ncbi:MAG: hypothetical protein HRU19_13740 [Pseudobacteriovorax sp.]|nr:hypothetical protein [Pseudobacteriovorax sp.]
MKCPGIKVSSPHEISFTFPFQSDAFLEFLSDKVFGIVPKDACDPKTLGIVDYTQSSGGYIFDQISSDRMQLVKSKSYIGPEKGFADKIVFVKDFVDPKSNEFVSDKYIEMGRIDVSPSSNVMPLEQKNNWRLGCQSLSFMRTLATF